MASNNYIQLGIGVIIIGLGLGLPYIEFLDINFTQFPLTIITFMQIGFLVAGVGYILKDDGGD